MTQAEALLGKLSRRVGPTHMISLETANSSSFKKLLTPVPRLSMVYRRHPHEDARFIGVRQYHSVVLDDKRQEFCNVLRCVGAKAIIFGEHSDWNRTYASPVTMQPDLLDDKKNSVFKFLRTTKEWKVAIKKRLDTWCNSITLEFTYDDDMSVNDTIVDTLMEKLEVNPSDRDDLLGPALHAKTMLALEQNKVHQIFEEVLESVTVEFFSKADYKKANMKWIKKNWGPSHVEAFLTVAGFHEYMPIFRDNGIDGRNLLKLHAAETLTQYLNIPQDDAERLAAAITSLGDMEQVDILSRTALEVENVRAHKFTAGDDDWEGFEKRELAADTAAQRVDAAAAAGGGSSGVMNTTGGLTKDRLEAAAAAVAAVPPPPPQSGEVDAASQVSAMTLPSAAAPLSQDTQVSDRSAEERAYQAALGQRPPLQGRGAPPLDPPSSSGSVSSGGIALQGHHQPPPGSMPPPVHPHAQAQAHVNGYGHGPRYSHEAKDFLDQQSVAGSSLGGGGGSYAGGVSSWEQRLGVQGHETRHLRDGAHGEVHSQSEAIPRESQRRGDRRYASGGSRYYDSRSHRRSRNRDRDIDRDDYDDRSVYSEESRGSRGSRGSRFSRDEYDDRDRDRDRDRESVGDHYSSHRSRRSGSRSKSRSRKRSERRSGSDGRSLRSSRSSRRRERRMQDFAPDEVEEMTYKVVMVGVVGVGKKTLMRRFGGAEFSSSEISKMSAHFLTGDIERFVISSWDESGMAVREQQALHRQNVLPYTKRADVLMVVYDITNLQSFKYLPDIMRQIVSSGTMPWASLVLVGNKMDLDSMPGARTVTPDMAFDLCRKFGFGSFFETSARTGANVTEVLSVVLSRCEQDRLREIARANPRQMSMGMGMGMMRPGVGGASSGVAAVDGAVGGYPSSYSSPYSGGVRMRPDAPPSGGYGSPAPHSRERGSVASYGGGGDPYVERNGASPYAGTSGRGMALQSPDPSARAAGGAAAAAAAAASSPYMQSPGVAGGAGGGMGDASRGLGYGQGRGFGVGRMPPSPPPSQPPVMRAPPGAPQAVQAPAASSVGPEYSSFQSQQAAWAARVSAANARSAAIKGGK